MIRWAPIVCAMLTVGAILGSLTDIKQNGQIDYLQSENVRQQDQIADAETQNRRYSEAIQELLKQKAESTARIVLPTSTCTLHDIFEQTAGC